MIFQRNSVASLSPYGRQYFEILIAWILAMFVNNYAIPTHYQTKVNDF